MQISPPFKCKGWLMKMILICEWAYHRVSTLYVLLKGDRTKALMFCWEHSKFRVGLPNETSQKNPYTKWVVPNEQSPTHVVSQNKC